VPTRSKLLILVAVRLHRPGRWCCLSYDSARLRKKPKPHSATAALREFSRKMLSASNDGLVSGVRRSVEARRRGRAKFPLLVVVAVGSILVREMRWRRDGLLAPEEVEEGENRRETGDSPPPIRHCYLTPCCSTEVTKHRGRFSILHRQQSSRSKD
jgi:hypothetical protein